MSAVWCQESSDGLVARTERLQVLLFQDQPPCLRHQLSVPSAVEGLEPTAVPPVSGRTGSSRNCWCWVECPQIIGSQSQASFQAAVGLADIPSPRPTQNRPRRPRRRCFLMPLLGWWHQVNSVAAGVLALLFQVGEHALVAITPDSGTGRTDVRDYLVDLSRFQVK